MRPANNEVLIGSVRVFDDVRPDKAQALKPLEEASEVNGAWQKWQDAPTVARLVPLVDADEYADRCLDAIVDECADVIQATCNLLASIGIHDITEAMRRCEQRNRERGRITK